MNDDAASVTCGPVVAVVHVDHLLLPGVVLSPEHPAGDIVNSPHTHAYTSRDL